MNRNTRKYKIDDYMLNLSIIEYRAAIRKLPGLLGISLNTFQNYRKIEIGDPQDIPYGKVVMMEKLFGIEPGSLMNYDFESTRLKDVIMVSAGKKYTKS